MLVWLAIYEAVSDKGHALRSVERAVVRQMKD